MPWRLSGWAVIMRSSMSRRTPRACPGRFGFRRRTRRRARTTPISALDLYVTNAFSQSPAGDDLLFYPDKREPTLGVVLSYIPSGRGVGGAAPTYWPAVRGAAEGSRFALASDRVHTRRTATGPGARITPPTPTSSSSSPPRTTRCAPAPTSAPRRWRGCGS